MIEIFDKNLVKIDTLRRFIFAQYADKFREVGSFKVTVNLESANLYLLSGDQYYILFDGEIFGRIDKVVKDSDSEYDKTIEITGSLAPVFFTQRVNKTLKYTGITANYIKYIIDKNIPTDTSDSRYMDISIEYDDLENLINSCRTISRTKTGGYLWDEMSLAMEQDNLGIRFTPNISDMQIDENGIKIKSWTLKICGGSDRRVGNDKGLKPVVFSQQLSNIQRSTYSIDTTDFCNSAIVAGEGSGDDRKWLIFGINDNEQLSEKRSGWGLRELFIDARDVKSEDEDSGTTMTFDEYAQALHDRADEKAKDSNISKSYSTTIVEANKQYQYGYDYVNGDYITVMDKELGVVLDAQITTVTKTIDGSREIIDIDFTYGKTETDLFGSSSSKKSISSAIEVSNANSDAIDVIDKTYGTDIDSLKSDVSDIKAQIESGGSSTGDRKFGGSNNQYGVLKQYSGSNSLGVFIDKSGISSYPETGSGVDLSVYDVKGSYNSNPNERFNVALHGVVSDDVIFSNSSDTSSTAEKYASDSPVNILSAKYVSGSGIGDESTGGRTRSTSLSVGDTVKVKNSNGEYVDCTITEDTSHNTYKAGHNVPMDLHALVNINPYVSVPMSQIKALVDGVDFPADYGTGYDLYYGRLVDILNVSYGYLNALKISSRINLPSKNDGYDGPYQRLGWENQTIIELLDGIIVLERSTHPKDGDAQKWGMPRYEAVSISIGNNINPIHDKSVVIDLSKVTNINLCDLLTIDKNTGDVQTKGITIKGENGTSAYIGLDSNGLYLNDNPDDKYDRKYFAFKDDNGSGSTGGSTGSGDSGSTGDNTGSDGTGSDTEVELTWINGYKTGFTDTYALGYADGVKDFENESYMASYDEDTAQGYIGTNEASKYDDGYSYGSNEEVAYDYGYYDGFHQLKTKYEWINGFVNGFEKGYPIGIEAESIDFESDIVDNSKGGYKGSAWYNYVYEDGTPVWEYGYNDYISGLKNDDDYYNDGYNAGYSTGYSGIGYE